ncbi:MAG: hypothetical protein ACRELG_19665 [Gemmataceae bacterium]
MNPRDQSRRRRFRPIGGRGCLLLSGVVLMVLAGCDSLASRQPRDPMLGFQNPPRPVAAPSGPASAPALTAAEQTPPPMPSSYTAPGPAALAVGETGTSESGRDLRIPRDSPTPTGLPGNAAARGVAPGVVMGNPVPATSGSTSHLAPNPVSGAAVPQPGASMAPAAGAAGMTFEQAQRLLKQYGVNWQRLDMDDGQWKFECSIPNPSTPSMSRHFYTTKTFPDEVSAIREVINQIEKDPIVNKQIK